MTRPAPDLFSTEAIRALVQEPHHTWRRALPGASDLHNVRAKSIRLGEIATPTQSRERNRNSNLVSIAGEVASTPLATQHVTTGQCRALPDVDRKILHALKCLGGFASAKAIRDNVKGASLSTVQSRLDRLVADGLVRNIPGQGRELTERGRGAL